MAFIKKPYLTPAQQSEAGRQFESFKQRIIQQNARKAYQQDIRGYAQNLEKELLNISSISDFEKIYNQIPQEVRRYMSLSPQNIKAKQQETIAQVKKELAKSTEQRRKADNRASVIEYRARERAYKEVLKKLGQGQLLNLQQIKQYAQDRGDIAFQKKKASQVQKEFAEKALKSGAEITKIDYGEGTAIIGGQKVQLNKPQLSKIKLSSEKRGNVQSFVTNVYRKIVTNKPLSLSDFEKARSLGISSKDLLNYNVDVEAQLKTLKRTATAQRTNFENKLGSIGNLLTKKQKDVLYQSQFISTTPYLQLPSP